MRPGTLYLVRRTIPEYHQEVTAHFIASLMMLRHCWANFSSSAFRREDCDRGSSVATAGWGWQRGENAGV